MTPIKHHPLPRAWRAVSILLLIAMVVIALGPQMTAQAASTTCSRYYTVQKGDRTPTIAHTFGLKWKEIRIANKLDENYQPKAGDVLCIPVKGSVDVNATTHTVMTFKASNIGRSVTVTVADLDNKSAFVVKVRDVTHGAGPWYKLGRFKISRHTQKTASYRLPDTLMSAIYVEVCLKNLITDEIICRTVRHYP